MPIVIDYSTVLETLERSGLHCVYPMSGAFGLRPESSQHAIGWLAADDPTIRPESRAFARIIPAPAARTLALMVGRVWQHHLSGPIWLMPASHWAFELQFGAADWLPALLATHGIDPQVLQVRSDGSAIEFQPSEAGVLSQIIETLFERMTSSDFNIAFPGHAVVAMLHHHQQVWWQTSDEAILKSLEAISFS